MFLLFFQNKILSYLLENKSVEKDGEGRQAFDFFKDKIKLNNKKHKFYIIY